MGEFIDEILNDHVQTKEEKLQMLLEWERYYKEYPFD
jgi:hypothetical protein